MHIPKEKPFYQLGSREIYLRMAFLDDRFPTADGKTWLRIFGMQYKNVTQRFMCRFYLGGGKFVDDRSTARDIYAQWPGLESKYHAYQYTCSVPKGADTLKVGIYTQGVPLFDIPIFQNEKPAERRTVGLCMKNSFGHLSPERLVEWFEMHRMVGVEHFMMFDSAVHGAARQALQYYENIGVADVISFPFFHIMHQVMRDNHGATLDDEYQLPQQVFLVSINECLYRYRTQFKYILVLDLDEVLVPRHHDKLTNIIHAISTEQPGSAGYMFRTAWHLHEMGPVQDKSIPSYLHMQRYNKRTAIMELQPKSIFNTDLCACGELAFGNQ